MKKEFKGLMIFFAVTIALLVGVDMWRTLKKPQQEIPEGSPSNCLTFLISVKKEDVGAIVFSTIPAMVEATGMKRTVLDSNKIIYEGTIDSSLAFEAIANQRGWNYYKSTKNC